MVDETIEGEIKLRYSDDDIVSESKATSKAIGTMGDSIESDLDDIGSSADKLQKDFEGVGKSAKDSGAKAGKSLDQTGEKAKKAASKLKETGSAGKKAGDDIAAGAGKGARAIDNMATSAGNADSSMETLATSMIGLTQTLTGVSDAVFGLSASLVGLEKTQFGIKGMEIAIDRMERGLIVAYNEGILTTEELNDLTVDLGLAYTGLSLEFKQAAADSLALDGQLVTLAINTAAAAVQTVISTKSLLVMIAVRKGVTASTVVNTAATATNTAVTAGNTVGKVTATGVTLGLTASTVSTTFAIRAMTTAMLLSPLAPFAIAAITAGAAFIALNDNIGGVRDSIEDLTGAERGSIPTLGFSITGLGEDIVDLNENVIVLNDSFEGGQTNAQILADAIEIVGTTTEGAAQKFSIFSTTIESFNSQIAGMGIMALNEDMDSLIFSVKTAADNMEEFPERVNLAMQTIGPSIQSTAQQFDLAWGEGAFRKRLIEMRKFGELTREEFNLIGDVVDLTGQKIDDMSKKNDELNEEIKQTEEDFEQLTIDVERGLAELKSATNAFFGLEGTFNTQSILDVFNALSNTVFDLASNAKTTAARLAQEEADRNSPEGMAIISLQGGSFDRTQADFQKNNEGFVIMVDTIKGAMHLFDPIGLLNSGVSLGEVYGKALEAIVIEQARLEAERLRIIAERAESVALLASRLGTTAEDVAAFTQTEETLEGFIAQVAAFGVNLTTQQIQDFLLTETGRNDLANKIGWTQREELLRALV